MAYAHAIARHASVEFICEYCQRKIKQNQVPPIASINKMEALLVPPEIADLNSFEKMFIQLVKAFQVVVKAGTVMNRRIPTINLNSKVVGRTFHLPLPLESNLRRVLGSEQTKLPNQDLYILVRGLPTKNRKIWESVVSFSKVLRALKWLKENNQLYEKLELPKSAEDLMSYLPDTDVAPEESASDLYEPNTDPDEPDAVPEEPDDQGIGKNAEASSEALSDPHESDPDEPEIVPVIESDLEFDARSVPREASPDNLHNTTFNLTASHQRQNLQLGNCLAADPLPQAESSHSPVMERTDIPVERTFDPEAGNDHVHGSVNVSAGCDQPFVLHEDAQAFEEASEPIIDADAQPDRPLRPTYHPNDSLPHLPDLAAMLTQREKDDEFYAPFTIFPIYDKRENKLAKDMYQMLKVQESSLDSRTVKLDAMCFPDLYPYGKNCFHEDREVTVQFYEFVHSRLILRQPQFRKNLQFLFYCLNQVTNRQLAAGIYQVLNITRHSMTASEFLNSVSAGEFGKDLSSVFQRVRNTEEFWKKPRSQILSMIDTYGPPTFFLTYSPADFDDKELEAYLRELEGEAARGKSLAALIAADPVSVSRFYDQKHKAMLAFLTAPSGGPLGIVEHYAWRREYQGRGTQHFHTLLWIKDAPVLGKSSSEDVAKFIQDRITCSIPDAKTFPELHLRVMKYQIHKCNSYCQRCKNTKTAGVKKVCRFEFPRAKTNKFILRDAPTAIAGRRNLCANSRLYELPRAEGEERVNDYNAAILLAWTGNIDLQYIGENSAIIGKYISKYQTKAEKSNMVDLFDDISNTKSVYSRLWNIGLRGLANRECGALEAADTLLGISLFGTDPKTTFKWVDVNLLRSRKVKSKKEIEQLAPDATDLFCPSLIDTHYPKRPEEMENVCLYDYSKNWDIIDKEPTRDPTVVFYRYGTKFVRQRSHPHIVQHYKYDPKQKPEQYFYSLLLLFKPWRKLEQLKTPHNTYAEAFEAQKDSMQDAMRYHEKLSEILAAHEAVTELIDAKSKELGDLEPDDQDDLLGPEDLRFRCEAAEQAMEEFRAAANEGNNEDLSALEAQLNTDQQRVYENLKIRLTHYVQCKADDEDVVKNPLRQFITGLGGTGKSFLVHIITLWVRQKLGKQVVICAPTGMAASAINGQTLHGLLQLPVEHGDTLKYARLSDTVLEVLRNSLKDVVLVIIDEISMVSNVTLMMIHLRLSEIFDTHERAPFGGLNLLVSGDLLQLSPVKGRPVYMKLTPEQRKKHFSSLSSLNLWSEYFTSYDELQINMRQRTDPSFCQLLANIRLGFCSEDDLKTLRSRQISFQETDPDGRLKELSSFVLEEQENDAMCCLPLIEMCRALNESILSQLPGEQVLLIAEDSVECKLTERNRAHKRLRELEEDCSRTAGLEKVIAVKEGVKIILKKNIDVTKHYVNGATGTLLKIKYDLNNRPRTLVLQMANDILELEPSQSKFELLSGVFVHRKQFPITVAYGISIHKGQGLSLNSIITDIGNQIFSCGQSYVALSRSKTLNGLNLINIDPSKIKALASAIQEYDRLRAMTPHLRDAGPLQRASTSKAKRIPDNRWAPRKAASKNIFGSTPTPRKAGTAASLWPAFKNEDQASSYANATLQCLLSFEPLRNALRQANSQSALSILSRQYQFKSKVSLSAENVRQETGDLFVRKEEQNPAVFLRALLDSSGTMHEMTRFKEVLDKRCKACSARCVDVFDRSILELPPTDQNKIKVTQLMTNTLSWSDIHNSVCSKCQKMREVQRSELQDLKDLLILEMPLWKRKSDGQLVKNAKLRSPGLQTDTLNLGNHRYKLHGALFHNGPNIQSGHCLAVVVSGKKFISADDDDISQKNWPSGSVGAHLLFYRRVDPNNVGRRPKKSTTVCENVRTGVMPPDHGHIRTARRQLLLDNPPAQIPSMKETAVPKTITIAAMWPRFENKPEGGRLVSCYANATLQSLLSYEPLRSALLNDPNDSALKRIASQYQNCRGTPLSAWQVREETDDRFKAAEQQCARDFMSSLINKHGILAEKTKFTQTLQLKCISCNTLREIPSVENILPLPIKGDKKMISELMDSLADWSQPSDADPACLTNIGNKTCPGKCVSRTLIRYPSDLFIVQINRAKEVSRGIFVKDSQFQMVNLPSKKLTFDESNHYKLHADLRHCGQDEHSGHYTAVVQNGRQFLLTDDMSISQYKWTPHCGKLSYLLVYRRFNPTSRQE